MYSSFCVDETNIGITYFVVILVFGGVQNVSLKETHIKSICNRTYWEYSNSHKGWWLTLPYWYWRPWKTNCTHCSLRIKIYLTISTSSSDKSEDESTPENVSRIHLPAPSSPLLLAVNLVLHYREHCPSCQQSRPQLLEFVIGLWSGNEM